MNTPEFNILSRANLIEEQTALAQICLNHIGDSGHYETWSGKYGQVIVDDGGQSWAGDLCYMTEKFGWTHEQYLAAYGFTSETRETQRTLTDDLNVHATHDGKFVLVIPLGGDGYGPLNLGFDTGSLSFVTTDRSRLDAARRACIAHMEAKRPQLEEAARQRVFQFAAAEKSYKEHMERKAKWEQPGNTVRGTRTVAVYTGGGYRGRAHFKSEIEQVDFVIAKTSPDFITSTAGTRYKRDTLKDCQVFTARQIGAQKAAATRKAARTASV